MGHYYSKGEYTITPCRSTIPIAIEGREGGKLPRARGRDHTSKKEVNRYSLKVNS